MKAFQLLVSTHPSAEDVISRYQFDQCLDTLNTSRPEWIEADSLEDAKELFLKTEAFKEFSSIHKDFWFYHNDGNGNLVQG